jgi:4Fe-4S single cluster domain
MDGPVSTRQKLSVSAMEYNLTEHCNLSCYQCDHASPLLAKKFASLADFERDMRALSQAVHLGELRLVGGEPLLHPQLIDFMRMTRETGIADAIKIYTNGMLLHTMPDEFWEQTDTLWVSTYPGVRRRMADEEIAAKCAEHGVLLDLRPVITEFNRTCINNPVEDEDLVRRIFGACKMAHEYECFSIYEGMFFRCSVAPFMQKRLILAGIDFPDPAVDGIQIHGNPRLAEDIAARLKSNEPMAACSYCLGSSGPMISHRQMNRQACKAWVAEDNRDDIEFARRNVRRQAFERRLHGVPGLAGRAVRKGRRILASLGR